MEADTGHTCDGLKGQREGLLNISCWSLSHSLSLSLSVSDITALKKTGLTCVHFYKFAST